MKIINVLIISLLCQNSFAQTIRNDFGKYFKDCQLRGSFALYDLKKNRYTFYNKADFEVKTCPASTFKIPNSLIALELGVVKDENEVIKWDGKERWNKDWNKDIDMKNAFKISNVGFYQDMARRIGAKNYQKYLKLLNYGNQNISGVVDMFWLNNTIKISPKNQIEMLVKLYEDKLPFSKRTTDILKKIMIVEQGENYVLRAKTGWYVWDQDKINEIGWWIGYIEKSENTYFFAIRVYKNPAEKNTNFGECRKQITKKILHDLDIL
jgi:beta-lactamase class D